MKPFCCPSSDAGRPFRTNGKQCWHWWAMPQIALSAIVGLGSTIFFLHPSVLFTGWYDVWAGASLWMDLMDSLIDWKLKTFRKRARYACSGSQWFDVYIMCACRGQNQQYLVFKSRFWSVLHVSKPKFKPSLMCLFLKRWPQAYKLHLSHLQTGSKPSLGLR